MESSAPNNEMFVIKRDGTKQNIQFDKITKRNEKLCKDLNVNPIILSQKVIESIYPGIRTKQLDELSAETALYMSTYEPEYEILAKRIAISNLHKTTIEKFSDSCINLNKLDLLNSDYYNFVMKNKDYLDSVVDHSRDYDTTYFGFKTLEKAYLNKDVNGNLIERPQHMWLRVATFVRMPNLEKIKEVYNYMSCKYFTHATPTLFHAGLKYPQLSSCFLLSMNDQLEDMLECTKRAGLISKFSGGIGINISMLRNRGSRIASTGGKSDGIVPFLKVWNSLARFVNQGGGKRKGSVAAYLEPHHPDIFEYLNTRKNNTKEEDQCLDLHIALWISDLFMKRVENNQDWCLIDPNQVKGLHEIYGEEYEQRYLEAEAQGNYVKKIKARDLWKEILVSQIETGEPYMLFKDHINRKSNQMNRGVIRGSNLCVAGETKILCDDGYHVIKDKVDETVNVWNGKKFSETVVKKTGANQQLYTVYLTNGMKIKCTPYHKFYIQEGTSKKSEIKMYEARYLTIDMKLENLELSKCEGNQNVLENAYYKGNNAEINKNTIPHDYNYESKLEWFSGFCDKECSVKKDLKIFTVFFNLPKEFLEELFLFLQTIGIKSSINLSEIKDSLHPYELKINNNELYNLIQTGIYANYFKTYEHQIIEIEEICRYNFVRVKGVVMEDVKEDTYCFTEPKEHKGVFNGILTGNCSEIVQYTDNDNVAVCNLCSISLPAFVNKETKKIDYCKLSDVVETLVENMNIIIDRNFYPVEQARRSNMEMRPTGIGTQGLADVFQMLEIGWDSKEAEIINKNIFATIYYHSLKKSMELSKIQGSYDYFNDSPASKGNLQPDLWKIEPVSVNGTLDWIWLRKQIKKYGLRNSLLTSQMPTASTAQILGNNESVEPFTSNMYVRNVLSGNFPVINKHLYRKMKELNIWNKSNADIIIRDGGSVKNIVGMDNNLKNLFKTSWELSMKIMLKFSADRSPYICQTQSLNCFMADPTMPKLSSMHMYSWKLGLKTGMYYLRRKPKQQAIQFSLDPSMTTNGERPAKRLKKEEVVCTDDVCLVCSS